MDGFKRLFGIAIAVFGLAVPALWLLNGHVWDVRSPSGGSAVLRGDLSEAYFSEEELEDLGLAPAVDPARVPYASDLVREELTIGCPVHDCIPSIDAPQFEDVASADRWLGERDLVISLASDDVARAYPFRILNYHEVVNDSLGGRPIAVSYCPLCRSALVFARPIYRGEPLELGVSGRLYRENLVLYDRQTGTFWSQLGGRPIVGPLVGRGLRLDPLRSDVLPWSAWKALYPEGEVLARPTWGSLVGGRTARFPKAIPTGLQRSRGSVGFLYDYARDPYAEYAVDPGGPPGSSDGPDDRPPGLPPKALVIGLELDGQSVAYPERALLGRGTLEDRVGGRRVRIIRHVGGSVRAYLLLAGGGERALPVVTAYWFAWRSFHPDTRLYGLSP